MTERQKAFLEFIENFIIDRGISPTLREIGKGLKVASVSSVKKMLDRLEEAGAIRRELGSARGIEVLSGFCVPVVGRVKAGLPVESEENIEGYISVKSLVKKGCFFLKVDGDSMKDKGILEGDYVMIRPSRVVRDGQIGVFRLNGEVTLKTFKKYVEKYALVAANDDYSDIPVEEHDDFEVVGELVMVTRFMEGEHDIKPA